jgi:orotidine-5'-phosphate decarboxylase
MDFNQKLQKKWDEGKFVCIGLDPDIQQFPEYIHSTYSSITEQIFEFNKAIIDMTHDLVLCYKPNSAFYESYGIEGISALINTVKYIQEISDELPVILDFKRADIGNTNNGYVNFAFKTVNADAVTVHPYLGKEAMEPFLDRKDRGVFVLCKTSNQGADEFQNLQTDDVPLYLKVAEAVSKSWNENKNVGLVVGATYPEELKKVREIAGGIPILIPGIGAQGGDLEKAIINGLNSQKSGIIISSSRGILYASDKHDFAQAARRETQKLLTQIGEIMKL